MLSGGIGSKEEQYQYQVLVVKRITGDDKRVTIFERNICQFLYPLVMD